MMGFNKIKIKILWKKIRLSSVKLGTSLTVSVVPGRFIC